MRSVIVVLGLGLLAPSFPALAEGDPNAAKGLVVEHCIACHEVPKYNPAGSARSVDAPPFQEIADDPGKYPSERLHQFLRKPHFPMTQFTFSERDIDDPVAFIQSLGET